MYDVVDVAKVLIGEADVKQQIGTWLGDSESSHHIKSSAAGMINITKCPPGMKIQQVQGQVEV